MPSNSSNHATKRPADEEADAQGKKIKVERPSAEQASPIAVNTANVQANFVSAASLVIPIPEISDEELLAFVLEFERKNGI